MIPITGRTTRNWRRLVFFCPEDKLRDAILDTLRSGQASEDDLRVIAYIIEQRWVSDPQRDKEIKKHNDTRKLQQQFDELVATGLSYIEARRRVVGEAGEDALRKRLCSDRMKRVPLKKPPRRSRSR